MNTKLKIAIIICILIIVLTGLFPPFAGGRGNRIYYDFIFTNDGRIDFIRLLIQWIIIIALAGGITLVLKETNNRKN